MHDISAKEGHAHEDRIGSESRVEFIDENGARPGVRLKDTEKNRECRPGAKRGAVVDASVAE